MRARQPWINLAAFCALTACLTVSTSANSTNGSYETQLAAHLVREYRARGTGSRPVLNATQPIQVWLNVWLIQILEFDIKQQVISTLVWKDYKWKDEYLRWDPADFGGLKRVFLRPHEIWIPDIELYNTIDGKEVEKHEHRISVWYNGTVVWVPYLIYRSTCEVDVTDFPFDTQECTMKFGSWVYADSLLKLSHNGPNGFIMDFYIKNSEWDFLHSDIIQYTGHFHGESYTTLIFKMILKRNSGLWVRLILLPMILLSGIACVVFWIPPNRPDRTTISMSLFASFFLLLLLIVQSAPPTSATRLITCCTINMVMVALALVLSVISVNLYVGRGDCRRYMRDTCNCLKGGICSVRTKQHYMVPTTIPQSATKHWQTEGPANPPVPKQEKTPELSRRQKLALTLDTVSFVVFLTNFVVVICVMHLHL